jgi:SAM-dependent methyltransferase
MTEPTTEIMAAYTEVFDGLDYLGPGDRDTTKMLVERVATDLPPAPRVADLGCGVGASALVLAATLSDARVLALDLHAPFIARLREAAIREGVADRLTAMAADMSDPPPLDGVAGGFDLIWSESAIYSLGRRTALALWQPLLQPNGWLVFSDIVWCREPTERSALAQAFWGGEYPDLRDADTVVRELAAAGFEPGSPTLAPAMAWANYYEPLRARLRELKGAPFSSDALAQLILDLEREIDTHDASGDEVALAYFVARRLGGA